MKEKILRQIKTAHTMLIDSKVIALPTWSERYSRTQELRPYKKFINKRIAFTLAETMVTLVILGIVAAVTVPGLARRQQESVNRTKFKKAVASYDLLMNNLIVTKHLRSNDDIKEWASNNGANDCATGYEYFKAIKVLSTDNKCRFRTADGVYWDITDIQRPIVALKEKDLNDDTAQSTTNRAFYLYAQFDDNKIFRVTSPNFDYDLVSANVSSTNSSVDRLWAYLKGETSTSMESICGNECKKEQTWNKIVEYAKTTCRGVYKSCNYKIGGSPYTYNIFDENGDWISHLDGCSGGSDITTCSSAEIYIRDPKRTTSYKNCNVNPLACTRSSIEDRTDPKRIISYWDCNGNAQDCTRSSISDKTDPNRTINYSGCDGQAQNCTSSSITDRTIANKEITYTNCNGQAQNCAYSTIKDNTIANKTITYSGCNGQAQNCTSSTINDTANNITYNFCDVSGKGCYYEANVNGHYTSFTGCDGFAGTCTNSSYSTSEGTYDCDGNIQNCTYTAYNAGGDSICLLKGTLITMADGTQKPIENLENGELVLSVNPKTWELEPTPILACDSHMFKFANESDKWYFEDGTIIETAHRHRFYNLEHNTVKYMDEWQIGEHACKIDGTNPKLVKHEKIEGDCQHYTLFTLNQTYFANNLMSGNRHTLPFGEQKAIQRKEVLSV